jgi:ABC-type phosphate transport system ATPase subunit
MQKNTIKQRKFLLRRKPCFARHFVIDEKNCYGIGPSGCGKSYLRLLNRMNDLIDGTKMTGSVIIDGVDIYGKNTNVDVKT